MVAEVLMWRILLTSRLPNRRVDTYPKSPRTHFASRWCSSPQIFTPYFFCNMIVSFNSVQTRGAFCSRRCLALTREDPVLGLYFAPYSCTRRRTNSMRALNTAIRNQSPAVRPEAGELTEWDVQSSLSPCMVSFLWPEKSR
jgi:hypothetical protein